MELREQQGATWILGDSNTAPGLLVPGDAPVARVHIYMQLRNPDGSTDGAPRYKGFYPLNVKQVLPFSPNSDVTVRLYAIPESATGVMPSLSFDDAAHTDILFNRAGNETVTPAVIALSGAPSTATALINVTGTPALATQRRIRCSVGADMSNPVEAIQSAAAGQLIPQFELLRGDHPQTLYVTVAHSSGSTFGAESNVLMVTFQSNVVGLSVPFEVIATTLPITAGLEIKREANLKSLGNLTVRNAAGVPVATSFEVVSRWYGQDFETAKPISFVRMSFTPSGGGNYTLDDSGANPAPASPVTLTDGGGYYQLVTNNLSVRLPKSGADLVTEFKLNNVEQLAAAKPRLNAAIAAKARITATANVGSQSVTVDMPAAFANGMQVKPQWNAIYDGSGTGSDGDFLRLKMEAPYVIPRNTYTPDHRFIFARGTSDSFVLEQYEYIWTDRALYRTPGDGFPLSTMPIGALVEDQEALEAGTYTVQSVVGNVVTFTQPLTRRLLAGCELVPVTAAAPLTAAFKVQSAKIYKQNAQFAIIEQSGWFEAGSTRVFPYLTGKIYWWVWAGFGVVRGRLFLRNQTDDIYASANVVEALMDKLEIAWPTASAVTASSDQVTTHTGAGSACERYYAGQYHSTAAAGGLSYCVESFAANFPSSLVAAGNQITQGVLPALAGGAQHRFPAHRSKHWDFYVGSNAADAAALSSEFYFKPNAQYAYEATRQLGALPPRKTTYTAADFNGNATQAEAATRWQRMRECAWDINANDSQVTLGAIQRMTWLEWQCSDHLFGAGSNQKGQHLGVWYRGTRDSGGDGHTNGRYDIKGHFLDELARAGNLMAARFGGDLARHSATMGLTHSALPNEGNFTTYNQQGVPQYEKGDGINGTEIAKPTHQWFRGLFKYFQLTGDPVAELALNLAAEGARRWNYQGIDQRWLGSNSFRGNTRPAKDLVHAYLHWGKEQDLAKARQYLMVQRDAALSQGGKGYYSNPAYHIGGPSEAFAMQPWHWVGYQSDALIAYLLVMRSKGQPDAELETFFRQICEWGLFGEAGRVSPNANAGFSYAQIVGSDIRPARCRYHWHPTGTQDATQGRAADGTLALHAFTMAGFWYRNAAFRLMADQLFEALAFYRDVPDGLRPITARHKISFNNDQFGGSSLKVWGQMGEACSYYLWYAAQNAALNPPSLAAINPTTGSASANVTLTLTGSGFAGAEVSMGGVTGLVPTAQSNTSITVTLPAGSLPAGQHPVMVTNQNGGQSQTVMLTLS